MAITVKHTKVSTVPDTTDTDLVRPSDWNADHTLTGLGTMAEQDANNVAITGGSISGATVSGYIPTSEKAQPLGVATLDAGGKVPTSQIPLQGDLNYQGTWNASTNTPTLTSSTGTKGYYYVVDVAGTTNLDGITDWQIGDWAIFNGTVWQKVDNTDAVTSVNGQVGTVVLTTTNIAEGTNEYFTTARARASVSAGTGISYVSATGVITNSLPDQVVSLTGAGTTTVSGTYPNFTITSADSKVGDVVGPASATDNAIARYDSTTGKLIQNSLVIIGDTGSVTGVNALTAESLVINNNATLGSSNTDTLDVNARITTDLEPNANNAKDIGTSGRNWRDGFFGRTLHTVNLELTGTTSFDGSQGASGQVLTSAGTGNTPTWTTPTTGTVTSVAATAGTGISVSGSPITSSGTLTITNTAPDQTVVLTAGTGITTSGTYPSFTVTNSDRGSSQNIFKNVAVSGQSTIVADSNNDTLTMVGGTGVALTTNATTDTLTITNSAPDQVVSLTGAGTTSISGTYPNFTITSNDSTLGTVTSVGGTGTVSGISLSGTVTSSGNLTLGGSLDLSSPPAIGNTTPNTVDATTISATTSILPATDNTGVVGTSALTWSNGNFTNLTVDSTLVVRAAIDLADSDVLRMGSSDDWQIYYNGTTNKAQVEMEAACLGIQYTNNGTEIAYLEKSTGTYTAKQVSASNGIMVNSATVSENYSIPSGSNAMSAGPMTVADGITVTIPSGNTWIIV